MSNLGIAKFTLDDTNAYLVVMWVKATGGRFTKLPKGLKTACGVQKNLAGKIAA